jgi:hypothetical protein
LKTLARNWNLACTFKGCLYIVFKGTFLNGTRLPFPFQPSFCSQICGIFRLIQNLNGAIGGLAGFWCKIV